MIMWGSTRAAIVATSRAIILQLNEPDILTYLEKSTAVRREEWRMEKVERDNGEGRREECQTLGKGSPKLTMKTQTERRKTSHSSALRKAAVTDVMC